MIAYLSIFLRLAKSSIRLRHSCHCLCESDFHGIRLCLSYGTSSVLLTYGTSSVLLTHSRLHSAPSATAHEHTYTPFYSEHVGTQDGGFYVL